MIEFFLFKFLDIAIKFIFCSFQGLIDSYIHRVAVSLSRIKTVIQLHDPKGVQVGLVKELYGSTFSYHMEDFESDRINFEVYVIQKYPFRLLTK